MFKHMGTFLFNVPYLLFKRGLGSGDGVGGVRAIGAVMSIFILLVLPTMVRAWAVDLPQTGQTTCYDTNGNVISCYGTGQDGDRQAGVAWPDPRFTDNGNGTVTDNLTGLMWTKDGNTPGPAACSPVGTKIWQIALNYIACLNANSYLGYTDWRLPNVLKLESLINTGQSNTVSPRTLYCLKVSD